jgi:hypothetical protein
MTEKRFFCNVCDSPEGQSRQWFFRAPNWVGEGAAGVTD